MLPAQRFRRWSRIPRPQEPIALRLTVAPEIALHVVAPSAPEAAALDGDADIIAAVLHAGRGRVFASGADVEQLDGAEFDRLRRAVFVALDACAPVLSLQTQRELRAGASANGSIAWLMFLSADTVIGAMGAVATIERPERYYGVPTCQITDGQLMCYSAAVEYLQELRSSQSRRS